MLSGLTASLRFLSGGRPPGMKASFRFSAGSGEGHAGVATRNRSFETWALSITKTTFLQRRGWIFYQRAPPPAAPIESVISSGSYKFLRRTEPEVGSLRFLADQTTRQPEVLNTGGSYVRVILNYPPPLIPRDPPTAQRSARQHLGGGTCTPLQVGPPVQHRTIPPLRSGS